MLPHKIIGGIHFDKRGKLSFINDFDMSQIKRFYLIEHEETSIIRAWQGHKLEQKWFFVLKGSFLVGVVQPDNWENPSKDLEVKTFILKDTNNEILYIPGGFANGFRALEPGSVLQVFSDLHLSTSVADNFRFNTELWKLDKKI